jgi:hypothetical protein
MRRGFVFIIRIRGPPVHKRISPVRECQKGAVNPAPLFGSRLEGVPVVGST